MAVANVQVERPRLAELDGLRGWAALSVVLFHIFLETFGAVYPPFRNLFTGALFNGPLAVGIFFVLSGDALSAPYFAGGGYRTLTRLTIKRYFRLSIPIIACCLIVLALMMFHQVHNHEAGVLVHREDWLGSFLTFDPNASNFFQYVLYGVYTQESAQTDYNPFLWTMTVELAGSFFVFLLLFVQPMIRRFNLVLMAVVALLLVYGSYFGCFVAGVLMAHARHHGVMARLHRSAFVQVAGVVLMAATLAFCGYWYVQNRLDRPLEIILPAIIIVGLVHSNKALTSFFASAPSRLLGRLSFPLYLIQFPVLVSLTSYAIVFASQHGGLSGTAIWTIALVSTIACLAGAIAFEPVERWTMAATDWIARRVLRNDAAHQTPANAPPR